MNGLRENCPNESMRQAFANGELSDAMAMSVANHVANCKACTDELDQCFLPSSNESSLFSESGTLDQVDHLVESVTSQEPGGISFSFAGGQTNRNGKSNKQSLYMGRYRILETIGRGSFGVVRVGIHPVLKKKVAVKVSHIAFRSSTRKMQFLREAETAARLDHPHIVRVVDADELPDQRCYIVFQYVDGKNLKELVDQRQLHLGQSLAIFRSILAGVQHAHQRGIVHRDLKLSNILIDADMQPRITDFGLALMLNHQATADGLGGTRGYMAPEQENGEISRIDARTDIFALGVLLAKLTAATPLNSGHEHGLKGFDAAMDAAGVPVDLKRICHKCCMSRPRDRYQTIGELLDDMEQIRNQPSRNIRSTTYRTTIGLQPFQFQHANLYREWLSTGRFGNELSKSIKSWCSRIHRFGFEPAFSVGMIAGDVGSGKSSLVNAGILPELASEIQVKQFDCRTESADEIEDFLMHYAADADIDAGTKTFVVLDHFSIDHFANFEVLCRALRRADGTHLQCLLVVSSPQLAGAFKLFDELEIAVDPAENMFRMPGIDERSAQQLILEWGRSNDCLPDSSVTSQSFAEQVVAKMEQEGELNLPTIHLFFDQFGDRNWDYQFISEMESIEHIRFQFAQQHWFPFRHRVLLPALVSILQSHPHFDWLQIADELQEKRAIGDLKTRLVNLKPELLVVAPNSKADDAETPSEATSAFVVAQDYYHPILSSYLRMSHLLGNAVSEGWYQLHQSANRWDATGSKRDLLPFHKAIPAFACSYAWHLTENERTFIRKSVFHSIARYSHVAILGLCLVLLWTVRHIQNDQLVYNVLSQKDTSSYRVSDHWYHSRSAHLLRQIADDSSESTERRLAAVSGLAAIPTYPDNGFAELTLVKDPAVQQKLLSIGKSIQEPGRLISRLHRADQTSDLKFDEAWLVGFHLLNLGDCNRIESLATRTEDLELYLTAINVIQQSLPLETLLEFALNPEISVELRMLIVDSLNEEQLRKHKDDTEFKEKVARLSTIAKSIQNQRLTSCVIRVLVILEMRLDRVLPNLIEGPNSTGFVNSVGMPMLKLPQSDSNSPSFYVTACEVLNTHIEKYWSIETKSPTAGAYRDFLVSALHPATGMTPQSVIEFCNYLSRIEGRQPYYQITRKRSQRVGPFDYEVNRSEYSVVPEADGYRLLHVDEWSGLVSNNGKWNIDSVGPPQIKWIANTRAADNEVREFGKSRPSETGFFDAIGNCDEIFTTNEHANQFACRGGMFLMNASEGSNVRKLTEENDRAWFIGFRVGCPKRNN